MLVTTCPDCKTTFRLSIETLEQADGQVRCGKCSRIFDGRDGLREIADPLAPSAALAHRSTDTGAETGSQAGPPTPDESPEPRAAVPSRTAAASRAAAATDEPDWLDDTPARKRRVWPWAVGTGLMALMLVAQLVHHFRSELAGVPTVGSIITGAYAQVGIDVVPAADLDQYDLLDLTAAAQPFGEEPGWLIIETRVINEGPAVQPVPHILVRLLDRWDATVAGRYFAPEEYTVSNVSDFSRMNAGSTIDAQFIIMDPGPSATGFELEICVPIPDGYFCESDATDE